MRISVDLPEPLGPSRPKTCPRGTARVTSSSATKSPNLRGSTVHVDAGSPAARAHRGTCTMRRHAGSQLVRALVDRDAQREDLVGALVGGLDVARRVLALLRD